MFRKLVSAISNVGIYSDNIKSPQCITKSLPAFDTAASQVHPLCLDLRSTKGAKTNALCLLRPTQENMFWLLYLRNSTT